METSCDIRRLRAVAASLRGIRQRVIEHDEVHFWDTAPFDNAIRLLEGAIADTDFSHFVLTDDQLDRTDYLVHLDSLVAFLEVYEKGDQTPTNVVDLPRHQR
ncbi:MAG: hypothetical protein MUC37_12535 [Hyphomicrobium sp.]|nr:hypothetical protein [Hyphomicrobium sp.]